MSEQSVKLNMLILLAFLLLSYGAGNIHCSTVHGNSSDMLSLLDFKTATKDPTHALRSWNRSIHYCNWTGVTCSPTDPGRVAALDLGGESLAGQITPSLGNLTFLQILNLSYNDFTGQLPPLNQLHELAYLDLRSNSLQGIIPDSLTNCSNLQYLLLCRNMLEGPIPAKIGSLYNLIALELLRNNLIGVIPPTVSNATQLELLNVQDNHLGGGIPGELGQLSQTEMNILAFGGNRLSGPIPPSIFNLTSLVVLDGYFNMLEMALPLDIGDTLPKLETLTLGSSMLQGRIPASLGNATMLTTLDLSNNSFVGEIPSFRKLLSLTELNLAHNKLESRNSQSWESLYGLTNCRSLEYLLLDNNQLQGAIPNLIGNFSTKLAHLQLNGNNLAGIVPPSLENLSGLIDLNLSSNSFTGSIEGWVGNLKKLQPIDLQGNKFVGSIPPSFGNLTGLTLLSLAKNEFEGPIPPIMGNLPSMSVLNLSQNNLNGHIPKELFSPVSTMTTCILSYNNLDGPIPPEISNLKHVTELDLSSNKLSGQIPVDLGECQGLEILLVDNNFLSGNIPKSVSGLKSLSMLNLSHNNLSGFIPIQLSNLSYLTQLDLSYNNLQGEIPRDGVFGNATAVSVEGNWGLCGGAMDLHLPICHAVSRRLETQYYLVRALIPLFGFTSLVMLTYIIFFGKKTSQRTYSILLSFGKKFPRVAYNDLARATGNFSELKLVGRGSYGPVYRGNLTQAKIQVAIKVFDLDMKCADKSFVKECEVLSRIRHRNLVPILTACSTIDNKGDAFKALIYEFMPNGNLDTWLHNKYSGSSSKCLSLAQRASIAIGIADALAYLHNDCERQIVHCDLKPTNILLDNDLNAYLGDFGIASLIGHSSLDTSKGLKGTIGYIAPEYAQNGQASIRGDVYSFGIVLLEMLICKRPTDPMFENELNIVNFVERNYPDKILDIIDACIHGEHKCYIQANLQEENAAYGCLLSLMQVALSCTHLIPRERMNIREVTNKLHSVRTSYIRATKREQAMLH